MLIHQQMILVYHIFMLIASYTVILSKHIPIATKITASTSEILGFLLVFFNKNATNIVNTIETGLVNELRTTELADK